MIKQYSLRLWVFLICCFFSIGAIAQINTPAGAVVPFGANTKYAYGIMPQNLPTSGAYGKSTDAANAYLEWKANYTEVCGDGSIRVKFDEPQRTVSEGIAYGMVLSAYAADKALFDGLWKYYKKFSNGNGIMHWRIEGCNGPNSGNNGATDAELDAAFALLIAHTQWPNATAPYKYLTEANNLISKIKQFEVNAQGVAINGDGWGFGDPCRNPSYQSPAYYREFAKLADASFWNTAVNGGYNLINANANATTGLISDWSTQSGEMNTCNAGGLGFPPTAGYGYDACRNPWRMAQDFLWNGPTEASSAKAICDKITTKVVAVMGASGVRAPLYQNGNLYSGNQHNATFTSTFALPVMATTNQTLMDAMYTEVKNVKDPIQNATLSGYFGNTLRCLSLFMMTGNTWKVGTTSLPDLNVKTTASDVLTGGTYDFQNVIKSGTKTVTFTLENKGFQPLALNGNPIIQKSGTDAALFTINQASVTPSLGGNQSVTFTITFTPGGATGIKTANISIASTDPDENPYTFTITGTGTNTATSPKISVFTESGPIANGGTYNMGTSATSSINSKRIKIKNTGDAPLNIESPGIVATGTGYTVIGAPTTIAINDSAYFWIRVTAATASNPAGSVTINNNDATNGAYLINLSSKVATCSTALSENEVYQDYDGNASNSTLGYAKSNMTIAANQFLDATNSSYNVAKYDRPATGEYDGIQYKLCSGSINITASKFVVSALVYSPAVGVPVQMNLKTAADIANTTTYPSTATAIVNTTQANKWERLYFNMGPAAGKTGITYFEIFFDPKALSGAKTYYLDDIRLEVAPCLSDLPQSGVLQGFEIHNNSTLDYDVPSYVGPVANPNLTGNPSSTVGRFNKSGDAGEYSDGIRYNVCGNKFRLNSKKIISMLVYSTAAGATIQFAAKKPDGADTDTYPDDAAVDSAKTVFANQWHRVYFDLSKIAAADTASTFGFDIFFDPKATKGTQTYYIDDIRYESELPCIAGIPASKVLNDFDFNRYAEIVFPGTFNTIYPNPSTTGINTSINTGQFVRNTGIASGTSVRFSGCPGNFDLGLGKTIIDVMVYSPNANTEFTMSLKKANGTSISDVTVKGGAANTWVNLSFDHSDVVNSADVAFIDILVDPTGSQSGTTTTVAQRTYLFDNLKYADARPEINVKALTLPSNTSILNTASFNMGTATIGDSTVMTFSIKNNGSADLLLTAPSDLVVAGANPSDFVIRKAPTYSTTIGAFGASNFVVVFKPTAGGARSASITIKSNDADEATYVFYLNGTAKSSALTVKQGATIYNAASAAYDFGTSLLNTATTPVTFTITSTGDDTLRLSGNPVVSITGTDAADFSVTQPVVTKLHPSTGTVLTTTFTVTFKPTASGAKNAIINIGNNSSVNPYTFKVTGSGDCPQPTAPNAGADQSTCDASVTLAGNTPTVGTGTWSIVGTSSATIKTPTSATSVIENLTAGQSVTLRWTIANTCGTNFDDVVITRNATPTVSFPEVSSVCAGGSVDLFPTVSGGTQPYVYTWTASSGTVPTGPIPTVTPTVTTTYSLVVKDANNCSNVAVQKVITVNAKPVLTVTPAASDICSGGSALLTTSVTGGTAPYSYAWDSAPSLVINNDKATASPSVTSTYFVTVSDANGCSSDKKSALVNVTNGGAATVTITPTTVAVCEGTPVTLTASNQNGGVPTYEWFVNGNKVTAGVNGAEFTSSTLSNNAQVTVKMTSSIACATGSPVTSGATTVTVNTLPEVAVNTSGAEICNGGSVNVNAVVTGGMAPYTYAWTSSAGNKPSDAGSALNPTETTIYSVVVTDANNCQNTNAASKQVVVNSNPSVALTPSSTDVCTGQSVVLTADVTGGTAPYNYQWTNVVGTTSSVTVAPTTETTYSVVVTDSKNCQSAAATSLVKVSSSVEAKVSIESSIDKACDAGTNATFTLISQGGGASPVYTWSVNNITVGLSAQTYSGLVKPGDAVKVTMVSSLACATGSPATSNVITLANAGNICVIPAKKTVTGPVSVTAGDEATYMTDAAPVGSVYTWSLPAGATIVEHNADYSTIKVKFGSTSGNIVLHETNPAGTTDSDPINVNVTPAGISALLSSSVNVMPNPGVDFVVTLGDAFAGNVNIIVKNALGTSVLEENVFKGSSSAEYNVNLTDFASGVYFLEIRTEQGNAVKRLIKQ